MATKSLAEMEALVGESVTTVQDLMVEAGMVAEFAHALRDDRAIFHDADAAQEAGYPAIPAPLTFTRVGYFQRYRPSGINENLGFDLGFKSGHVVHGEQSYTFERPVYVGDTLTGTTTLSDVYQREDDDGATMTFAVYETEFRTLSDELVVTARNTRIEINRGDGDVDEDDEEPLTDGGTPGVGDVWPTIIVEDLKPTDFVKYAGASGDFNPIHFSESYAREAGHDGIIGQGMLTAGYAARLATDWFGVAAIQEFSTRFSTPVTPGDTLTVTGEVIDCSPPDSESITADLEVTNQHDDTVVTGEVTAHTG